MPEQKPNHVALHFRSLDGLRLLFIALIVFYHGKGLFGSPSPGRLELFAGQYGGIFGNEMFFMLSGFLMAHHYKPKIMAGTLSFPRFLQKRLYKLYPLYFVAVCGGILFNIYLSRFSYVNFRLVAMNLLMIASGWIEDATYTYVSPLWFACVLLLCYIIFYFILHIAHAKRNENIFIYASVALVLWGWILMQYAWEFPFSYFRNGQGYLCFFAGCLLYELYTRLPPLRRKTISYGGILCLCLFFVLSLSQGLHTVSGDVSLTLALFVCPVILLACLEFGPCRIFLGSKVLNTLAKLSLHIYVWHDLLIRILLFVFYEHGHFFNQAPFFVRLLVYLCMLSAICLPSYLIIEKKFCGYLKRKWNL